MGRTHNPDNRYAFICKVTGETVKTNPKQFAKLASRYDITPEELDGSYISRSGRRAVADAKMTPEAVVTAYGVHINVAQNLKCTVKPAPPRKPRKPRTPKSEIPVAVTPVEIPVEIPVIENIETSVDNEPDAEYVSPEETNVELSY